MVIGRWIFFTLSAQSIRYSSGRGAGVLALSSYQELGEWTLIATDSAWGRSSEAQLVTQNEQQGIGLRHYRLIGRVKSKASFITTMSGVV